MTANDTGPGSSANQEPNHNPSQDSNTGPRTDGDATGVDLVTVRLLGLPVAVQARAQEHTDELTRELLLIAEQMRQQGDHAGLPARLVALIEQLTGAYSAFTGEQERQLADAMATGVERIDLTYSVPADVADAAKALEDILEEADEYCRAGQHLLTLPTPPDLVRYRRWFLEQFVDQVVGARPVSFADYPGSTTTSTSSTSPERPADAAGLRPA